MTGPLTLFVLNSQNLIQINSRIKLSNKSHNDIIKWDQIPILTNHTVNR